MSKKIVTVQDISCYGQCSITVALPVLSAFGVETAILPSAILSTHTGGFTGFTVHDLTEEMPGIVNHWISEGIKFDAIYTGYIGDTRQFDIINDARKTLLNDGGLLIVDPAMADWGKLYPALDETIVEGMKKIVRTADVILPNLTEAAFLTGRDYIERPNKEQVREIIADLSAMGPDTVILTGVSYEDNKIGAAAYCRSTDTYHEYFTERVPKNYHGTGDVFSSVAVADIVNGKSIDESLKDACEFTVKCIKNTLGDPNHDYGVKFESVIAEKK
ncbi:MAG: pyridoxamine kinase [Lachnospiraceae bacterium]|nr:pyridoxamine kinase [Lachnospiraceae bacterium]